MHTEQNRSLIKLRHIKHYSDDKKTKSDFFEKFFIYPAAQYNNIIWSIKEILTNDPTTNYNKKSFNYTNLTQHDHDNRQTMFYEILKYGEKIKILWERKNVFDSDIFDKRYKKTQAFYLILCDFTLSIICHLYYANLYKLELNNIDNVKNLFIDGKAEDFTFDKSVQYGIELQDQILKIFDDWLDKMFPPIHIEDIINVVTHDDKVKKKIKEKLKEN